MLHFPHSSSQKLDKNKPTARQQNQKKNMQEKNTTKPIGNHDIWQPFGLCAEPYQEFGGVEGVENWETPTGSD